MKCSWCCRQSDKTFCSITCGILKKIWCRQYLFAKNLGKPKRVPLTEEEKQEHQRTWTRTRLMRMKLERMDKRLFTKQIIETETEFIYAYRTFHTERNLNDFNRRTEGLNRT